MLDTLCSEVKWCRKAAQGSAWVLVRYPNLLPHMEPWQSLASPAGHRSLCLPLQEPQGPQKPQVTSCSGGIPWDTFSQFPAVQCHHHLSPLADSSGVSHVPSTGRTLPVPSSSLLQPPGQSEVPTSVSASPPPSSPITSLVSLTLAAIGKDIMRSSVSSQFIREGTGDGTAPGLYPLQGLALQNWGGGSGLIVLCRSAYFSTPFPSLLYHLSLVLFLKDILFRSEDSSSLGGFVCQERLLFLSSVPLKTGFPAKLQILPP